MRIYEAVMVDRGAYMIRALYSRYKPIFCMEVYSSMRSARNMACLFSGVPLSEMKSYLKALEKRRKECKKNGVYTEIDKRTGI